MFASTVPPPPGPKKNTASCPSPPGPGIAAWARRIWESGGWDFQVAGRSKSSPAPCAAGAPPAGTVSPRDERVPGAESLGATGALGAEGAGAEGAAVDGMPVDALSDGALSFWPQAARLSTSSGSIIRWDLEVIIRVLISGSEERPGAVAERVSPPAESLGCRFLYNPSRKRSGAGAFCGLQNRCPGPVAVRGVGSIPMRFRHSVHGFCASRRPLLLSSLGIAMRPRRLRSASLRLSARRPPSGSERQPARLRFRFCFRLWP